MTRSRTSRLLQTGNLKLAVIGSSVMDILVQGVKSNERIEVGTIADVEHVERQPGGCGLNLAVTASRLGVETTLFTWLGVDDNGRALLAYLRRYGVRVVNLGDMACTAEIVVLIDIKSKDRSFLAPPCLPGRIGPSGRAGKRLRRMLPDFDVVMVTGVTSRHPMAGPEGAAIIRQARRERAHRTKETLFVGLDIIAEPKDCEARWESSVAGLLGEVDWFLPNEAELLQVVSPYLSLSRCAVHLFSHYKNLSLIGGKRAADGSWLMMRKSSSTVEMAIEPFGIPHSRLIDQTGAGDVWCAAFVAKLLERRKAGLGVYDNERRWVGPSDADARVAAVTANAVAALCVTRLGATKGMSKEDLETALSNAAS